MSQSQRQHLDQWEKMVKVLSPERYESMKNYASQLLFELRNSDHLAAAEVHRPLPQVEVDAPEVLLPPPVPSKKRKAWTVEEHWMFLIGLDKYGKGDWKSIARDCVRTRTSTQIASHAQKYFLRQNASEKQRKRKSIHDIPLPESYSCLVLHPTRHRNWVPPPPPPHNWELFQHCHKSSPGLPFPPLSTPPPPSVSDPPPPIYNTSNDPFLFNTSLPYPAWPLDRIHVNGLNQTSKAYATANSLSSSDVATTQQQLQELQQAQQEIFYLNPPNILPQQIDEFGNFNNCLNNAEAAPCSAKYNAIGHKRSEM